MGTFTDQLGDRPLRLVDVIEMPRRQDYAELDADGGACIVSVKRYGGEVEVGITGAIASTFAAYGLLSIEDAARLAGAILAATIDARAWREVNR